MLEVQKPELTRPASRVARYDELRMTRFVLPRGCTGFYTGRDRPEERLSAEAFRERAARLPGWTRGQIQIVRFDLEPGVTKIFHRAVIRVDGAELQLVGNPYVPCVALTEEVTFLTRFLDPPEPVYRAFEGVRVLDVETLHTPLAAEHLAELAPVERKQVSYWKAQLLGEVLFNLWD